MYLQIIRISAAFYPRFHTHLLSKLVLKLSPEKVLL